MAASDERIIRRHRRRTDDGKGYRRLIAGKRYRLPAGLDAREAERRFLQIEALWKDNERFCREFECEAAWVEIALFAAEQLRLGKLRIPMPPIEDISSSFGTADWPIRLALILRRYTDEDFNWTLPETTDGLSWDESLTFHEALSQLFPSVNWLLPERHKDVILDSSTKEARHAVERLAFLQGQAPPDPSTPLISGTLHEALRAYEAERRRDFTRPDGSFDNSGHHMLGIVRAVRERASDLPLAQFDFARCQALLDYWRDRPEHSRTKEPLTKKTCQNHIGEIKRFFVWLHLTGEFGWRKPADFEFLDAGVRDLPSDRPSLGAISVGTFSLDELTALYKHAIPAERLLLVWCLNCAHGAAEFGRVEWGDLFLGQEHPWRRQGLDVEATDEDAWCGFIRPKSGVLGWWRLWPETVRLIEWWRAEWRRNLSRESVRDERVMLTKAGTPLYRDQSRNAQTGFANAWNRLLDRIEEAEGEGKVRRLPFGTLRNQLPDWLGGGQAEAVVASVALCHGIPHAGDKLLYKHYSNRPWAGLFKAQQGFRDHLRPMFASVPDALAVFDPVGDRVRSLWSEGVHDIPTLAERVGASTMTVRRRLDELGLLKINPR